MVRENREMKLYGDALKKCEWAWENREDFREIRNLEQFAIYDGIFGYAAIAKEFGYNILYCIHDLNNDGTPELIVGIQEIKTQTIKIRIIYRYENEDLEVDYEDRYVMEIYKGGIIENCIGTGLSTEYHYYCYAPYSGKIEHLGDLEFLDEEQPKFYRMIYGKAECKVEITEEEYNRQKQINAEIGKEGTYRRVGIINEENPKYYGFFIIRELKQKEEITEEEYNRQKELYTEQGKEEFQWKELQGFLEEGETFESLFGDY